ncbi:uncharacterized protein UBRO_20632 [Ustilago bromivora]|uniref:Secreted protein n=1 Tax=Ustilago bromivora TaxID=307758 RepID=A0A1K0H6Y9_9BASI|nr:uncharacterized protein UBRO_20632 [Ustilago bromivora]
MPVVTLALVCLLPVKLEASTTQHQVCFAYLRLTASDEAATVQGTMPMLTTANLRACFRQSLEGSAAMTARQRSSTVGIGRQAGKQASKQASKQIQIRTDRQLSSSSSPFTFCLYIHQLSISLWYCQSKLRSVECSNQIDPSTHAPEPRVLMLKRSSGVSRRRYRAAEEACRLRRLYADFEPRDCLQLDCGAEREGVFGM